MMGLKNIGVLHICYLKQTMLMLFLPFLFKKIKKPKAKAKMLYIFKEVYIILRIYLYVLLLHLFNRIRYVMSKMDI